jgi:hypothetical protein
MRYVVVTDRVPKGLKRYCAFCCEPITDNYTRDVSTSLVYCGWQCIEAHIVYSHAPIEDVAKHVA